MTDRISEIEERLEAATDGPWEVTESLDYADEAHMIESVPVRREADSAESREEAVLLNRKARVVAASGANPMSIADAEAIAHTPTDIAYLLDLVRRQQAVVEVADGAASILQTLIWREDHLENTIGMKPGQAVHAQAIDRLRHALDKLEDDDDPRQGADDGR